MLTPEEKRKRLRDRIGDSKILKIPGAFNAACAELIETKGFECAYISGAATSGGVFGVPDIGIVTLQQTVQEVEKVARVVDIPVIADADTGFGGLAQASHTQHSFEAHGASGIHIEDQVFPKRCGHLQGKELVPVEEMSQKISNAVNAKRDPNFLVIARCDAFGVTSMDDLLYRLKTYQDAGADMVFPEALHDIKDYEKVVKEIDIPVMANMTEFGKTPYIKCQEFENAGVSAVLFPVTLLRYALGAVQRALDVLLQEGSQKSLVDDMFTRQEFYDLIDYQPNEPYQRKY